MNEWVQIQKYILSFPVCHCKTNRKTAKVLQSLVNYQSRWRDKQWLYFPETLAFVRILASLHDVATLIGSDSPQPAIIKERDGEQAGVGWPQALWNIVITAKTSWAATLLAPQTVRNNCQWWDDDAAKCFVNYKDTVTSFLNRISIVLLPMIAESTFIISFLQLRRFNKTCFSSSLIWSNSSAQ